MKIIAIEANIGAGKSTLLQPLADELKQWTDEHWEVLIEPVDEDPEFQRLLKVFIENPTLPDERVKFQRYLTNQRQDMLKDLPDGNYIIERSLFSDIVFSQLNFLDMELPSAHYLQYYYEIVDKLKTYPKVDCIVYLDRAPKSCLESIAKRGRDGEDGYSLSYLEDVKRFHDACLPQIARKYETPLVTLNLQASYADVELTALTILEEF